MTRQLIRARPMPGVAFRHPDRVGCVLEAEEVLAHTPHLIRAAARGELELVGRPWLEGEAEPPAERDASTTSSDSPGLFPVRKKARKKAAKRTKKDNS